MRNEALAGSLGAGGGLVVWAARLLARGSLRGGADNRFGRSRPAGGCFDGLLCDATSPTQLFAGLELMKKISKTKLILRAADVLRDIGVSEGLDISAADLPQKFGDLMRDAAAELQRSEHTLHGKRTETLFAYIVAQMGNAKLITEEGAGEQWASEDVVAPDWRIVLSTGESVLVEVKNFYRQFDLTNKFSIQKKEFEAIQAYAHLAAVPLYVATYWAKPSFWTLLPANSFALAGARYTVDFEKAYKDNEMSMLGDFMLAVPAPLTLTIDQAVISKYEKNADSIEYILQNEGMSATDSEGTNYTKGGLQLVFQLGLTSGWESEQSFAVDGEKATTRFIIAPPELPEGGLSTVGAVSTLLTRQALFQFDDTRIKKLSSPTKSNLLKAVELAKVEGMSIAKFHIQPSSKPYKGSYLQRTIEMRREVADDPSE